MHETMKIHSLCLLDFLLMFLLGNSHNIVTGPQTNSATFDGENLVVCFLNGRQLTSSDGKNIRELEVAGEDRLNKPVAGVLKNDRLIIDSKAKEIKHLRYGWKPYSGGNLVNESGWPVSTFMIQGPYKSSY